MLEKPELDDEALVDCLRRAYGLDVVRLTFLPLGADVNTAVYRAETAGASYFVKLRRADFDPMSVAVPAALHRQGVVELIPPLAACDGALWTQLEPYTVIVYPFVSGSDATDGGLTAAQWVTFGRALRAVHDATLPAELLAQLPRESFSPRWRDEVRSFQELAATRRFTDPISARLAAFLNDQRAVIDRLVRRAEELAARLATRALPFVLCHADIHAANLLLDHAGGLYLVDWDTILLAPRERDLMFVGAGIAAPVSTPDEDAAFYRGYGPVAIDQVALAYYRHERIVEDIAAFCRELLLTEGNGPDRERSFSFLTGSFGPGDVVEIAFRTDRAPSG